jgi:hypothetical protein
MSLALLSGRKARISNPWQAENCRLPLATADKHRVVTCITRLRRFQQRRGTAFAACLTRLLNLNNLPVAIATV